MRLPATLMILAALAAWGASSAQHARAATSGAEGEGRGSEESKLPEWFDTHSPEYYTMPQFVVPVIEGNVVTRQISLLVTLETIGTANREKILDHRQRLQDVFLRDIYGVLSVRRADAQGYHDALRTRLRRAGDRVLGPGVIESIFVKTTYDRPLAPSRR